VTAPGVVPKLTSTPGRVRSNASWEVGRDTDAVMHELGLADDEIKQLRDDGAF
jgi:crotonobetainyl-CoA:carnitine CoA-transferase CaiB-like acyl-CoA transferase